MRAERIHHAKRLKTKRNQYCKRDDGQPHTDRAAGILYRTPARCSCFMCGNPRKYFGEPTLQERRQMQAGEDLE